MQTVSMLEFRRRALEIVQHVQRGQRIILTYRGRPVARLEPISESVLAEDDPFYALDRLADAQGTPMTNEQIDRIVYGT